MAAGWAFEEDFATDAHFVAYTSPMKRRLGRDAVGKTPITINLMVFDVDAPADQKSEGVASDAWRQDFRAKVAMLDDDPFIYETRGGARIVYSANFFINTPADAAKWSKMYCLGIEALKAEVGIEADPACVDWQRLYRLPDTVRDGVRQQWPTLGNPHAFGRRMGAPGGAYSKAAAEHKPWRKRAAVVKDFTPQTGPDGMGIFYHLLYRSGMVIKERDHVSWLIRCPNEKSHSSGRTGDGSTLLYRPTTDTNLGVIHCKHAHCVDMEARQWLKFWNEDEIKEARRAAGEDVPDMDALRERLRKVSGK